MKTYMTTSYFLKINGPVIILSILLTSLALLFKESLYGIFGVQNYVTLHLIIEIFLITISFTIMMQAWMTFPHILSNRRLWIGALFLTIGIFEFLHVITYKGMPFFLTESSPYKATWFYIVGRLTQAIGLLIIIIMKDRQVSPMGRTVAYFTAIIYALFWVALIINPKEILPTLVIEGDGMIPLKQNLQYIAIIASAICMIVLVNKIYANLTDILSLMLLVATFYLIISDAMFTRYISVYDISNFIGHIYQAAGFYFLMRAFYHTSVEEPFVKQREAQEQIKHMAFHNTMTKLPNHYFFSENIEESINNKPNQKKAVLFLDIDRFKKINESLGHGFGDLVIQAVAKRLKELIPDDYFLSHMSGDKFIVFLPLIKDEEEILNLCNRIQAMIEEPIQIRHMNFKIVFNIGIAIYPEHGMNKGELLKHAQIAMEESKKDIYRYKVYNSKMDQQQLDRLVLEQDLYNALRNREFFIVYQPQVDLKTGRIFAMEALVRWQHPTRGIVSPAEFISIAEDTGLIIPMGECILKEACTQVKAWHDMGLPKINISVNLSPRQFFQQNFTDILKNILKETGLSPHYLELEITESMMMDLENAIITISNLKELGVKIAIDDFGTGYSSLQYLEQLSIDRLKIDRSFVNNIVKDQSETSIISMIISMAKHLKLEVIAEGVELPEQLEYLQKQNCMQVQGYIFSPPIVAELLTEQFYEMENRFKKLVNNDNQI